MKAFAIIGAIIGAFLFGTIVESCATDRSADLLCREAGYAEGNFRDGIVCLSGAQIKVPIPVYNPRQEQ